MPSSDDPNAALTVTFDKPTSGFGFDTASAMGTGFTVLFTEAGGSSFTNTYTLPVGAAGLSFFGFQDNAGIKSAVIKGIGGGEVFAVDNFAFSTAAPAVPEASTTISFGLLLALGMGGVMVAAKRKKQSV